MNLDECIFIDVDVKQLKASITGKEKKTFFPEEFIQDIALIIRKQIIEFHSTFNHLPYVDTSFRSVGLIDNAPFFVIKRYVQLSDKLAVSIAHSKDNHNKTLYDVFLKWLDQKTV